MAGILEQEHTISNRCSRSCGDAATGTRVLQDLYRQIKATALTPDLDLLWTRLGIPMDPKSQPFDDAAPLAAIRIAITARLAGHH